MPRAVWCSFSVSPAALPSRHTYPCTSYTVLRMAAAEITIPCDNDVWFCDSEATISYKKHWARAPEATFARNRQWIRDPEAKALTNQNMAIIEKAFKEWCDKQIDGLANEKNSF